MFRKRLDRLIHLEESEKRFRKNIEQEPLEKKDVPAMILAALLVFLPVVIVVVLLLALLVWLFFLR